MKLQTVLDFMEGTNVFVESCFYLSHEKSGKVIILTKGLDDEGNILIVKVNPEAGTCELVDKNTFTAYDKRKEWTVDVVPVAVGDEA